MAGRRAQRALLRRIARTREELAAAREEQRVLAEQLAAFVDDADEAHVRSIVTENRYDAGVSRDAARHADVMRRAHDKAVQRSAQLEAELSSLIDHVTIEDFPDELPFR